MINEILLRTYTEKGMVYLEQVQKLIQDNTNMQVTLVDHRNLSLSDFEINEGEKLISIDRFIAEKIGLSYVQISRVFDEHGNVLRRYENGLIYHKGDNVRILDSDIVYGHTMRRACEIFETNKYSVPLVVLKNQDLIDIEDLIFDNSFLMPKDGGYMKMCSYMINTEFFTKRTSLPVELYQPIKDILS